MYFLSFYDKIQSYIKSLRKNKMNTTQKTIEMKQVSEVKVATEDSNKITQNIQKQNQESNHDDMKDYMNFLDKYYSC